MDNYLHAEALIAIVKMKAHYEDWDEHEVDIHTLITAQPTLFDFSKPMRQVLEEAYAMVKRMKAEERFDDTMAFIKGLKEK